MEKKYNIGKTYLNKQNYPKIIDNSFTQLAPPTPEPVIAPTVDNFFQLYNTLFYDIPKEGENNSHQFLINQSSEYIGNAATSEEIEALIAEIDNLRQQLLDANERNLELTQQQIPDIEGIGDEVIPTINTSTTSPQSSVASPGISGGGSGGY